MVRFSWKLIVSGKDSDDDLQAANDEAFGDLESLLVLC